MKYGTNGERAEALESTEKNGWAGTFSDRLMV